MFMRSLVSVISCKCPQNKSDASNKQKSTKKLSEIKHNINGHTLEMVKSIHYLGVDVDENLTWEVHVKSLTRVLSYKLHTP